MSSLLAQAGLLDEYGTMLAQQRLTAADLPQIRKTDLKNLGITYITTAPAVRSATQSCCTCQA